jgi:beta-aspartyl-peptidase (threonine type)
VIHAKIGLLVVVILCLAATLRAEAPKAVNNVVLAIHGGAGAPPREKFKADPKLETAYRDALKAALQAGYHALQEKGTSLDGVEAAIKVMEDSPLFNAGKGAVFTHEGRNELDAAIMDGEKRRAGAVAGITRLRNPISAARAVMEKSEHVLLVGDGADRFAIAQGLEEVSPVYFWTEPRWKQLLKALEEEKNGKARRAARQRSEDQLFGTVGAVAFWKSNLAAGTSTGGLTNKRHGRVGDSPIIGAGTYADNGACAISATGHGEVFIRHVVAHNIAARVKYLHMPLEQAAAEVLEEMPKEPEGVGGLIALDIKGRLTMPFNTPGMFRGYITSDGSVHVAIFAD